LKKKKKKKKRRFLTTDFNFKSHPDCRSLNKTKKKQLEAGHLIQCITHADHMIAFLHSVTL